MISLLPTRLKNLLILNRQEMVIKKMKQKKEKKEMIEEKTEEITNLNKEDTTTPRKYSKMMKMNGIKLKRKIENVDLKRRMKPTAMMNNKNSQMAEVEEEEDSIEGDREVVVIEEEGVKGKQTMITLLK